MTKIILVVKQEFNFSNDFGSYVNGHFENVFYCKDYEEAEWLANFFIDQNKHMCGIKPLRIMVANEGVILKEYV